MSALERAGRRVRADGGLLADAVADPHATDARSASGRRRLRAARRGDPRGLPAPLRRRARVRARPTIPTSRCWPATALRARPGAAGRAAATSRRSPSSPTSSRCCAQAHAEGDPERADAAVGGEPRPRSAGCARPADRAGARGPARAGRIVRVASATEPLASCPDPRKRRRSPSTPPTASIPGAFEGETVTRRRFMTADRARRRRASPPRRSCCPRSASRSAPLFERPPVHVAGRRPARGLPRRHLRARRSSPIVAGHRRGRQDHGLRAQAQPGDRQAAEPDRATTSRSSRSPRAACTSAARSATSQAVAALHLPVPRRRLRLPGQGRRRPAGAPARPLLHARARRPASRSARASRSTPSSSASRPRDPASTSTASASTSTRARFSTPKLARRHEAAQAPQARRSPTRSTRAPSAPATHAERRARSDHAKEAGHPRGRLARRAHRRCPAACAGCMFRKVPKGTNWFYTLGSATMFAFLNQAVTGVFLAMYYDPSPTRRLRVGRATSPTTSSSASSCAACTSGARR